MKFENQVIFIISYENWGHMLMSKHHYAIELGRAGNEVYFINHPDKRKSLARGEVRIVPTEYENVSAVSHRMITPYFVKYKINWLFNFLVSFHIRKISKAIGKTPDIIWSFDIGNTLPLKYFPETSLKISMPVDGPYGTSDELRSVEDANIIVSVTERILSGFKNVEKPKFLVNHGVPRIFLSQPPENYVADSTIRVGYSGSLVRNDLDINCFLTIIREHPDVIFEFWGEHDFKNSNIHLPQDVHTSTLEFLKVLHSLPNVILHGPVNSHELAKGLKRMDVLLICYSIKNDQNHHKVLEYLSTGKVIVSNFLSSYADQDQRLLEMSGNSQDNVELPHIFNRVIGNLEHYNSADAQSVRINYARQFSYSSNIERIENFINQAVEDHSKSVR